jgi:aerobic-type carbon monoxide dehydrogenase small subunit (CoxS/CutS family)
MSPGQSISLNVNGTTTAITIDDPAMPLLYALRDDLGAHGPRFGCGLAQCGACTVHLDGNAIRSCVYPAVSAVGHRVVTLEVRRSRVFWQTTRDIRTIGRRPFSRASVQRT